MFDTDNKRISAGMLFLICAVTGAIVFLGIYGIRVLDPVNTDWLFNNDHDLRQHYIGWCAFRRDAWHFPIGLIDSLSYPNSISVIYTDSIPIMAVLFKTIGPYLPQEFQYFGIFGILSFALMGGFASLLLRRFVTADLACIIGSVFYVTSAPVIHRMFFHTALAAQWIVVAALVLWVYDDLIDSPVRKVIYWGLMGFICVGIHSYFLPMAGMILAALAITQAVRKKSVTVPVLEVAAFCALGLANLFILGGFYGLSSASGLGLGTFGSNLNTFINPWEIGQFLPKLPLQNDFQSEGMAYLGAGILMLFVIVAAGLVFRRIRRIPEEAFHSEKIHGRMAAALVVVSAVSAILPNVAYNDIQLFWMPYPSFVEKILSVFRSNGRLIWTAMYILFTAAISFTAYTFRHTKIGTIVLAAALVLQLADMTDAFTSRYELYKSDYTVTTLWDEEDMSRFIKGKKEFIFLYDDNDITLPTGYYGYLHGMRQNNYYFARDIQDKVDEGIALYLSELGGGNMRDDAVYILRKEDYRQRKDMYDALGADMIVKYDHVFLKAK